jgi:hypothetical protein
MKKRKSNRKKMKISMAKIGINQWPRSSKEERAGGERKYSNIESQYREENEALRRKIKHEYRRRRREGKWHRKYRKREETSAAKTIEENINQLQLSGISAASASKIMAISAENGRRRHEKYIDKAMVSKIKPGESLEIESGAKSHLGEGGVAASASAASHEENRNSNGGGNQRRRGS